MRNDLFDYSYQYGFWHSDTPESRARDIDRAMYLFDAHALYPKSKSDKVLEIGCGMGRFLLMLKKLGYKNLFGLDIDPSQYKIAKNEGLDVCLADANEFLSISEEKYNVIYFFDVLEHIEKEKQLKLLKMIYDHTTDDGFIALSVPNALSPTSGFYRYTDFTHTTSYTDNTCKFLLHNAGFHFFSIRPQNQETAKIQNLKLPWARLYRYEFGLTNFILTPNLIVVAFKKANILDLYLKKTPIIQNDYMEVKKENLLKRILKYVKIARK